MKKPNLPKLLLALLICVSCMEQYDPKPDWAVFEKESEAGNQPKLYLNDDGSIPEEQEESSGDAGDENPIAAKYNSFCASCHGAGGAGDGVAAAGLNPPPRNLTDPAWRKLASVDLGAENNRAFKVIKLGAAAAGVDGVKSASMSAWGSILSDEEIHSMVEYILAL